MITLPVNAATHRLAFAAANAGVLEKAAAPQTPQQGLRAHYYAGFIKAAQAAGQPMTWEQYRAMRQALMQGVKPGPVTPRQAAMEGVRSGLRNATGMINKLRPKPSTRVTDPGSAGIRG